MNSPFHFLVLSLACITCALIFSFEHGFICILGWIIAAVFALIVSVKNIISQKIEKEKQKDYYNGEE